MESKIREISLLLATVECVKTPALEEYFKRIRESYLRIVVYDIYEWSSQLAVHCLSSSLPKYLTKVAMEVEVPVAESYLEMCS